MATLEDFAPSILNSSASNSSSTITTVATTSTNSCTSSTNPFETSLPVINKALESGSSCSASAVDLIVDKLVSSLDLNDSLQSSNAISKDLKSVSSRSSSVAGSLTFGFGGGNMFSEVFESNIGTELESGSLEDTSSSLGECGVDKNCKICRYFQMFLFLFYTILFVFSFISSSRLQSPRVLSCLHVFCESCLSKLLNDDNSGSISSSSSISSAGGDIISTSNAKSQIECPTCKQITTVSLKIVFHITLKEFYSRSKKLLKNNLNFSNCF